ncbi:MAG: endonuclease IV [Firmicutes bacterium HGW-Firmicutes-15]|nr:MAG: endonuclease IV [Firmicutes bacterium HGW-Firmicutes-15]
MLNIGCHLSTSKGFKHMGEEALSLGANTFQFFTRNPRGSKAKKMDEKDASALMALVQEHQFAPLLGHAPYTLNACASDPHIREFAHMVIKDDLANMEYLPNNLYTFHPGNHVGQGVETGIELIGQLLNQALRPEQTTLVLLEIMSGKGSEVGTSFEEINQILQRVNLIEKMGVCLDTCHIYSAGYDIVNDLDGVLTQFDEIVGLDKLKAIHLNDSLNPHGSRKDRHAKIGQGTIGMEAITNIINHPRLRHLPFYLETPNELPGYAEEIKLLKAAFHG